MTNRSRAPQVTSKTRGTHNPRRRTPLIVWALMLLAVAFPAAVMPTLGFALTVVGGIAQFALAHITATCTLAATVLLARSFPGTARGIGRFLGVGAIASLTAVRPA